MATPTPVATQTPRPATPNPTVVPTQAPTATPEPVAPEPTATPISNYTISFVLPGYTVESQTVKQGNIASKPNITLDSSVIEGSYIVWLDENEKSFDFNSPISSNRTLKGEIAFKVIDESTLSSALSNPNINTIGLEANIDLGNQGIEVNKDLTIYGNNYTISSNEKNAVKLLRNMNFYMYDLTIDAKATSSRGIQIDTDVVANVNIINSTIISSERGITYNFPTPLETANVEVNLVLKNSVIKNSLVSDYDKDVNTNGDIRGINFVDGTGNVTIENSKILGYKYGINVVSNHKDMAEHDKLYINLDNTMVKGWATFNVWGSYGVYNIKNSTLLGINNLRGESNSFSTIVFNDDLYNNNNGIHAKANEMIIENSTVTNYVAPESLADGRKQELIRIDCGVDKLIFKGNVNLTDTTGENLSAIDISEMDNEFIYEFVTNKVISDGANVVSTSNGKSIPLIINPYTVVTINNSQDLINAINNQEDMQIWKISSGTYNLTRNDSIPYLNQTGWFMPIVANDISIIGEGNPVITTDIDVENGNLSSQDLIAIIGDYIKINGVTIIAQRDPGTQTATNKAIEVFGGNFVLENSVIKPHSDTSTYAGSIYLSNPGKKTTLNNVDMYYGRISTSGANNMSELVLNDVLIDYANSVLEEAPYYGFSNTTQTKVSAKNSILTVANITGADLTTQTNMLPIGMTIETKESTMGVKNLEVLYTEVSENIVVKYDLPVGFLFDLPKVTDVEQLAGPYEKIFTGNEEEKSEAANIIGNDIIMYYYYKDSNNVIYPLLTVNGNALVKNKFWGGHLNYYNEDGRTTTKLETGSVIKDTYLGVKVPSHKGWTTSTNPSVDPATVSTGWLNAAKGNEVFVTIAVIHNGKVFISNASVSVPEDPNTPWDGITKDTSWYNASSNSFTIKNAAQLAGLAKLVNEGNTFEGKTIALANDMDLNNKNWTPMGVMPSIPAEYVVGGKPFMGTFDGNNKTISNLVSTQSDSDTGTGLFGFIKTPGVIKNLTINNAQITGKANVGTLVGSYYTGSVDNCIVKGHIEVIGNYKVAGLAGEGYGTIKNSKVEVDSSSFVKGVYLVSDFEGDNVGGLIGFTGELNSNLFVIENSSSNVNVEGTRKVGGLIGFLNRGVSIKGSIATGNVSSNAVGDYITAKNISVGGLVGETQGTASIVSVIENCSSTGTVVGPSENKIGSLVGYLRDETTFITIINSMGTSDGNLAVVGNGYLIEGENKYTSVKPSVGIDATVDPWGEEEEVVLEVKSLQPETLPEENGPVVEETTPVEEPEPTETTETDEEIIDTTPTLDTQVEVKQ